MFKNSDLKRRNDANFVILLFAEPEDLGLAVVFGDSNDATTASLQIDGCIEQRRLFATQLVDEDVEWVVAQILRVARLVDVPDVGHTLKNSLQRQTGISVTAWRTSTE